MNDPILFYTFITLVLFFLAAEIYRVKHYINGTLVELCQSELGIEELIASRFKVQLQNGQIVEAEAMRCTMCMGQFSIGDEVKLTKTKDKYIINLPVTPFPKKSCHNRFSQ